MDQFEKMMAWEEGTLSREDTLELFQELVDTEMAWKLQGFYGRMAADLIQAGLIKQPARN